MTNFCKHYSGMFQKETCEAGIRFDSLPNHGTKQFHDSCPCFGPKGTGCDKAEYLTKEELEKRDKEMVNRFLSIAVAREAIEESLGGPWKRGIPAASGAIDCPVCKVKKSLRFSRAGVNGHIHAGCSTEGCVRWME